MIRRSILICLILLPSWLLADSKVRIVTLSPHLVEIVFALGAGEQIVATSEHSDYPEAARDIRTIGNSHSLSIETIVGLQPDIILAWRTGNPELQLQRLADLGVKIFYSKPENTNDLLNEITTIGEFEDRVADQAQLQNQLDTTGKTVLSAVCW